MGLFFEIMLPLMGADFPANKCWFFSAKIFELFCVYLRENQRISAGKSNHTT